MKNGKIFFALLIMAFACSTAFAAASAPSLQITNYTTVPGEVYPGTLGYLQVTVTNKGDAAATSVTAYYNYESISKTVTIGDIGTGSTAQISIPFKISQSAVGSIQLLDVDIYYSYETSGALPSKKVSLSIPLTVLQYKPLEVSTMQTGGTGITPGEKFTLALDVRNTEGVVNNLIISMPENSSFSIDGANQEAVGSIPSNTSKKVSLTLVSSTDAKTGTYSVPVVFTYQDALRQPTEETIPLGPVSVLDSSTQYRLTLEPEEDVEIGAQVPFKLTLENTGSAPVSATVDINSTSTFTPIGAQRAYFDSVPAGGKATAEITLGILATQSAGYYTLPITLLPVGGKQSVYYAGIAVKATPEITVTLDSSSSTPTVQIANTGNSQIRSVYASATTAGSSVKSESFIGTLNVDDFATLALTSSGAGRTVNVEISYKDTSNIAHTLTQTLTQAGNSSFSGSGNSTRAQGASPNFSGQQRSNNPLGFILGPGGRSASGTLSSEPNYVAIGAVVIVVAVAGYFAYRKFYKAKKKTEVGKKQ